MIFEPVRATLAKQSPDQILYSANIGDPSTPQRENVQKNKPHLQLESVLVGGRRNQISDSDIGPKWRSRGKFQFAAMCGCVLYSIFVLDASLT